MADWKDDVGFGRLQSIVGEELPTTVSAGFTQVEAPLGSGNYMPNTGLSRYVGKTFDNITNTSGGSSWHANSVATNYYSTSSLLPGTDPTIVDVYEANDWMYSGFLNTGDIVEPNAEVRAIQNHSWIGSRGFSFIDEEIGRRLDYAINRDGFVAVVGENNGSSTTLPRLLGQSFHTISVGRSDGRHSRGFTTIDGTGRIKPEIVAPSSTTSYAAPMVAGAAGILHEQLSTSSYSLTGADLPRTIKAILLASARKDTVTAWGNTATRPLDDIYGAGELNIHNAFMVLKSGRKSAGTTQQTQSGWAAETVTASSEKSYFFTIPSGAQSTPFCATLTWHRVISSGRSNPSEWGSPTSSMADLNLRLYTAAGTIRGSLISQSASTVDNIELIYQSSLAPGDYEIVVLNGPGLNTPYALAWHSLPTVGVTASASEAKEIDGQDGILSFTRTGDTTYPAYVPITITGDAIGGIHYQTLSSSLLIPAGQTTTTLTVDPIPDDVAQGDRTVTVSIADDFAIVSDSLSPGSVTIIDKPADEWRFSEFSESELSDPLISGDTADPDTDSIPNLLEYGLGLNPKAFSGSPVAPLENSGYLAIAVTKNPDASDLIWSAEVTSNLTSWSAATIITNNQNTFEARDSLLKGSEDKRMIRIKVARP